MSSSISRPKCLSSLCATPSFLNLSLHKHILRFSLYFTATTPYCLIGKPRLARHSPLPHLDIGSTLKRNISSSFYSSPQTSNSCVGPKIYAKRQNQVTSRRKKQENYPQTYQEAHSGTQPIKYSLNPTQKETLPFSIGDLSEEASSLTSGYQTETQNLSDNDSPITYQITEKYSLKQPHLNQSQKTKQNNKKTLNQLKNLNRKQKELLSKQREYLLHQLHLHHLYQEYNQHKVTWKPNKTN